MFTYQLHATNEVLLDWFFILFVGEICHFHQVLLWSYFELFWVSDSSLLEICYSFLLLVHQSEGRKSLDWHDIRHTLKIHQLVQVVKLSLHRQRKATSERKLSSQHLEIQLSQFEIDDHRTISRIFKRLDLHVPSILFFVCFIFKVFFLLFLIVRISAGKI